ncbi:MAG: ABC transporter permease [Firmicutes bacterium]|uniref:ABC transporter permease n=1 Tax=Candidatus Scatoplasma merdavium TaxID=2840932 RepID=A0A9D9GR71_9BACL|nr:ABC transporter permease [Candidatus Scatoplasma merdavium]
MSEKKKDIALFKSLGIKKREINGIFYCEISFLILFCLLISFALGIVAVNVFNKWVKSNLGISISVLNFNYLGILISLQLAYFSVYF